jgi:hypothetical protein
MNWEEVKVAFLRFVYEQYLSSASGIWMRHVTPGRCKSVEHRWDDVQEKAV